MQAGDRTRRQERQEDDPHPDPDVSADEAPSELAHLNWIFFRDSDNFESAVEKLTTAIQTDYDWVQAHRELQTKALEWERSSRDKSFLLTGTELLAAEFQLDTNASKEPHPTGLQKEYVKESRQAANRQRTILYTALLTAGIILAALAVFGWVQAGNATTNAHTAQTQAAFAHVESTRASGNAATSAANAQDAQRQAQIALVRQLGAHAVAQSGSRLVASASADGTIRIWDLVKGRPVFTLSGHTGPVNGIDFLPDDRSYLLASGGADGSVRLWRWEADRQAPPSVILAHLSTPVRTVAFSPDKKDLAVGAEDGTVRVYDLLTRLVKYTLSKCSGSVTDLAFSADGATLASSDNKTELCLWELATGELINQPASTLSVPDPKYSYHVAFSPDGNYVAAGYGYNAVLSYRDYPIDNNSDVLVQHTSAVLDVAFNHEGTRFASASEDWRIGYCYVYSLKCDSILYLKAHQGPVNSLAFSPDDRWLVSGGEDGNVLVWNAEFPYISRSLVPPILYDRRYSAVGLAFSPDGRTLASSNWDGTIRLWDLENGSIQETIPVNQGNQGMITLSPDGTKLAVAAQYPPHRIWNLDGTEYRQLPLDGHTSTVAFSPDGKWLATDDSNKFICLWAMDDRNSACQVLTQPDQHPVTRLAFSPDGRYLASDAGSKVLLWDLASRPPVARELGSHAPENAIFSLAFSPDGTKLASGGSDYTIQVWSLKNQPVASLTIPNSGRFVRSLAFSADSQMLLSSNEDWTVRWWDAATGQPLVAPVQVRTLWRMDSAAFSPDGRWAATGSYDGIIDVWPGNFDQWRQLACRIANRNLTRAEYTQFIDPDPSAFDAQYTRNPTCPDFLVETQPVPTATP